MKTVCSTEMSVSDYRRVIIQKREEFIKAEIICVVAVYMYIYSVFFIHLCACKVLRSCTNTACMVLKGTAQMSLSDSINTTSNDLHCFIRLSQQAINTTMNNKCNVTPTQSRSVLINCHLASLSLIPL